MIGFAAAERDDEAPTAVESLWTSIRRAAARGRQPLAGAVEQRLSASGVAKIIFTCTPKSFGPLLYKKFGYSTVDACMIIMGASGCLFNGATAGRMENRCVR
jgi:hypothetical protein